MYKQQAISMCFIFVCDFLLFRIINSKSYSRVKGTRFYNGTYQTLNEYLYGMFFCLYYYTKLNVYLMHIQFKTTHFLCRE